LGSSRFNFHFGEWEDIPRLLVKTSLSSLHVNSIPGIGEHSGSVSKKENIQKFVELIPFFGQKVLGSSSVATLLFCCIVRQCHRQGHYAAHRDIRYGRVHFM